MIITSLPKSILRTTIDYLQRKWDLIPREEIRAAILAIIIPAMAMLYYRKTKRVKSPILHYQKWWGPHERNMLYDKSIRPYEISYTDEMIEDLQSRLINRRDFTPTLQGAHCTYGVKIDYLEKLIDYWAMEYDFKKRLTNLNRFPHYMTNIQGLDIHFIRVQPLTSSHDIEILPILLLHGWPSSSKEFEKVIPLLTTERTGVNFVFEVIAPDLPGYGFSEGTTKMGLNTVQIGIIMKNLMARLGYDKFYIQAGDWGSQCAAHMCTLFPDEILGFHNNMAISSMPMSTIKVILWYYFPVLFGESEYVHLLKNYLSYAIRESGYFHIQATKPDTIGVALSDSPAGLAAYIVEKMAVATNRDQLNTDHGGLEALSRDDVLETITIAWMANNIVTSSRLYAEAMTRDNEINVLHNIPTDMPTAALKLKHEVMYQPDWVLRDKYPNLVHSTTLDYGGHYAALELPELYTEDLFNAAEKFLKYHQYARQGKNALKEMKREKHAKTQ